LGLGRLAAETKLKELRSGGGSSLASPGALRSGWRGAENVWTKPASGTMTWAVSKAAPLRRLVVQGNLDLFQNDVIHGQNLESEGAYIADSYI